MFYVLKTETDSRLGTALNKAAEKRRACSCQQIIINADGASRRLLWDQVQYLERVLRRVRIVTLVSDLYPADSAHFISSKCYRYWNETQYTTKIFVARLMVDASKNSRILNVMEESR